MMPHTNVNANPVDTPLVTHLLCFMKVDAANPNTLFRLPHVSPPNTDDDRPNNQSGDLRGAEATCSQLLRTSGLSRPLRQKASYRRAVARQRQVDAAGTGGAGSGLARKAYRDAYLSVKLSQVCHMSGVLL